MWYLCVVAFISNFSAMSPELAADYHVPKYFAPSPEHPTDLFSLLGETARPDYRWIIAGPARSGSIFHIDPNQTNAWNVSVRGRKKWIFYPPDANPPGVECTWDGGDVVVPISTGEWLLSFWKFHVEARNNPDATKRPLEIILNPGEIMFVPHGYWHMVVNIDDCIALTHNYVSLSNLADCLRFLRNKVDQISGVRDRYGSALQPEEIYATFVRQLPTVIPQSLLDKLLEESYELSSLERIYKERRRNTTGRVGKSCKRPRNQESLSSDTRRQRTLEGNSEITPNAVLNGSCSNSVFLFSFQLDS